MPIELTREHVLKLLLNGYHDGRYLNGHPELVQWLDEWTEPHVYYIEQLPDEFDVVSYKNVRVWSSKEECERRKAERIETAREFYSRYAESAPPEIKQKHHLEIELDNAIANKDFTRIVELKALMRRSGIRVNQKQTSIRKLAGL